MLFNGNHWGVNEVFIIIIIARSQLRSPGWSCNGFIGFTSPLHLVESIRLSCTTCTSTTEWYPMVIIEESMSYYYYNCAKSFEDSWLVVQWILYWSSKSSPLSWRITDFIHYLVDDKRWSQCLFVLEFMVTTWRGAVNRSEFLNSMVLRVSATMVSVFSTSHVGEIRQKSVLWMQILLVQHMTFKILSRENLDLHVPLGVRCNIVEVKLSAGFWSGAAKQFTKLRQIKWWSSLAAYSYKQSWSDVTLFTKLDGMMHVSRWSRISSLAYMFVVCDAVCR